MKHIFFILLIITTIIANTTNKNNSKEQIYFSADLNWIPYSFQEDKLAKGYILDYIKLLGKKGNFEPIFLANPWSQNIEKIKSKEIDVLSGVVYKKSREDFLLLTNTFIKQKTAIVSKSNRFDLIDMPSLNGKTIGMIKGWNLTNILLKNYPNINVRFYDNLDEIFNEIDNNKIDATIQYSLTAKYYINSKFLDTLKVYVIDKIKGYDENIHLGVRKDLPKLVDRLNQALKSVTDEELEHLEDKWASNKEKIYLTKEEKKFISNHTIKVSFTENWAPISFIDNGKAYGLGFEFWNKIVKKTDSKVEYKKENQFYKTLNEIKNKTKDITIATSRTKDRDKYAIFSKTYFSIPIGIATKKDENYIADVSYLRGKRIAVGRNYTSHKLLQDKYPYLDFVLVSNIKEGLELLSSGNVYALIDSMPALAYNIKINSFNNIKISGDTNLKFNLQIMIRDDYIILKNIINKALNSFTLKEKEDIYNKWSNLEIDTPFDYELLFKILFPIFLIFIIVIYKNRQLTNYQKELHKAKSQLELSLDSFKSLLNFTVDGIFILKNRKIIFFNNQAVRMFKYKKQNLLNISVEKLFSLNHNFDEILIESKKTSIEINATNAKNRSFPILIRSKEILFENEKTTILSIIDLTKIRQRERLFLQQSKIASLSEMLGNIAHQWRQPLSFISTAVTGLKIQKEFNQLEEDMFFKTIDEIEEKTQYLSKIINDFQYYLNGEKIIKEFDTKDCIEQALGVLNDSFLQNKIEVVKELALDFKIISNENELNQVLIHILNNAKDAIIKNNIDDKSIYINSYKKDENLIIEITDNAGGIDKKILDKIFDPYFTTKHQSQGTGLGLYMTHKIVTQNLRGKIDVKNYKNDSTKVSLQIPIE